MAVTQIPLIPNKIKRVNLALDLELLDRAKALKIDVHNFFRFKLQEAVETLESRREMNDYFDPLRESTEPTEPETTQDAIFGAMVRFHDRAGNPHPANPPGSISERIKESAQRAAGQ